jgi:hypothetical protein
MEGRTSNRASTNPPRKPDERGGATGSVMQPPSNYQILKSSCFPQRRSWERHEIAQEVSCDLSIKPDSPIGRPLAENLDGSADKASHPNKHFFQEDGPARIPQAGLASATCVIRNTMKNQERVREVLQWAGGHPPSGVKEEFVSFWRFNVPVGPVPVSSRFPIEAFGNDNF